MASPSSFALTETGELSVQYVRRRQMLRVVNTDEVRGGTIEVSLPAFLKALGIEPAELVPTSFFLLFACPHDRPVGGLGELVATYDSYKDARHAFQQLRLSADYRNGWAELFEIGAGGRTRALCWFGRRPPRSRDADAPDVVPAVRRRWRSRRGRQPARDRS